ncbi:MAG: SDR family oxidoreductase [Actinomycetota bacterium]|nr:SDR family oxidoreductase [Actinomycetota bacterium]
MDRLDGKSAVVIGADGKLGPIWIEALFEAGATVTALCEPGRAPSDRLKSLIDTASGQIRLGSCDVSDPDSVQSARDAVIADVGAIDVLVVNAGIDTPPGATATWALGEFPVALMRRILEVNVIGAFNVMQVFSTSMLPGGSVIAVGSMYGSSAPMATLYDHIETEPAFLKPPAYGASKSALSNLVNWLAVHWAPTGLRFNTLSPGGVAGGQDPEFIRKFSATVPMHRLCEPEELKGPLLFLASDASSYITGSELLVDGGRHAW